MFHPDLYPWHGGYAQGGPRRKKYTELHLWCFMCTYPCDLSKRLTWVMIGSLNGVLQCWQPQCQSFATLSTMMQNFYNTVNHVAKFLQHCQPRCKNVTTSSTTLQNFYNVVNHIANFFATLFAECRPRFATALKMFIYCAQYCLAFVFATVFASRFNRFATVFATV